MWWASPDATAMAPSSAEAARVDIVLTWIHSTSLIVAMTNLASCSGRGFFGLRTTMTVVWGLG